LDGRQHWQYGQVRPEVSHGLRVAEYNIQHHANTWADGDRRRIFSNLAGSSPVWESRQWATVDQPTGIVAAHQT